jgi:hypothetical protein
MTTSSQEWTDEERAEKVAEALVSLGLSASAEDTGGGIICVVVPRTDGGAISWGTADATWGASITDADDQVISSIATSCPSDTSDPRTVADALKQPSLDAGAAPR